MEVTSTQNIWQEFADKHNGNLTTNGKNQYRVEIEKEHLKLKLSSFKKGLGGPNSFRTSVVCIGKNTPDFEFNIRHQGLFSGILEKLGRQDFQVFDTYFDDNFIIQGSNENKVCNFFQDEQIRNFIPKSYELSFALNNNVLTYEARGFINELSILDCLVSLMIKSSEKLGL